MLDGLKGRILGGQRGGGRTIDGFFVCRWWRNGEEVGLEEEIFLRKVEGANDFLHFAVIKSLTKNATKYILPHLQTYRIANLTRKNSILLFPIF